MTTQDTQGWLYPNISFLVCDIAAQHFLMLDGNWLPFGIDEGNFALLHKFETRKEAETFCLERIAAGCHCRPYSV